jgi:hypothetical protein
MNLGNIGEYFWLPVHGSVWISVEGSVRDSVWISVWDSVQGSVFISVSLRRQYETR